MARAVLRFFERWPNLHLRASCSFKLLVLIWSSPVAKLPLASSRHGTAGGKVNEFNPFFPYVSFDSLLLPRWGEPTNQGRSLTVTNALARQLSQRMTHNRATIGSVAVEGVLTLSFTFWAFWCSRFPHLLFMSWPARLVTRSSRSCFPYFGIKLSNRKWAQLSDLCWGWIYFCFDKDNVATVKLYCRSNSLCNGWHTKSDLLVFISIKHNVSYRIL